MFNRYAVINHPVNAKALPPLHRMGIALIFTIEFQKEIKKKASRKIIQLAFLILISLLLL